ncbi:MAG: DUF3307 domain-containing protein [Caldilineaceae bacterium]
MHLLLTLLIAHLFADFPLQTNQIARLKKHHPLGILPHVLIYVGVTALLFEQNVHYWQLFLGLGIAHYAIDLVKLHVCPLRHEVYAFIVDQCLHLLSMVLAAYLAHRFWPVAPRSLIADEFLLLTLLAALLPALMVYFWVWTTSVDKEQVNQSPALRWISEQMLIIEQRFGLAVIGIVVWALVKPELIPLVKLALR